jgi:hypothetical protein
MAQQTLISTALVYLVGHPMGASGAVNLLPSVATLELNKTFLRFDIMTYSSSGVIDVLSTLRAVIFAAIQHDCFAPLMMKTF